MPKERLQTKWSAEDQRWVAFLSMENNSLARGSIDLVKEAKAKNVNNITSLEDVNAIRAYLENDTSFKKVQKQLDDNRYAVLTGGKQKPEAGFFLQLSASLLGVSLLTAVINTAVDLGFKKNQADNNKAFSYEDLLKQSASNFAVTVVVAAIGMGMAYSLSHKKHHEIMDANNAHKTIEEFLGRLDQIRDEVQLKNAVLVKIEAFLRLNIVQNENSDKNFRNEIIAALDKDDNIETWKSVNQSIKSIDRLRVDENDIEFLKTKLVNQYVHEKASLRREISPINNLPGFLSYIDANMLTNQIDYGTKILPKAFIVTDIVQLLQGKHLIQERQNAEVNSKASHVSSRDNNAHDETYLQVNQVGSSDIASSSSSALAFKPNKESSTDEDQDNLPIV